MIAEPDTDRRVDLYTDGSATTLDRRRHLVARIEELQSAGHIDRFRVRTWPKQVTLDGPNHDIIAVVTRFRQWADEADVSLGPEFDQRHYDRSFTDESGELVSLPTAAVAVYRGDDLVNVAPRVEGTRRHTVDATLDALAGDPGQSRRPLVVGDSH